MKSARKKSKKYGKSRKFWQRGSSGILYILIGLVIVGAFLLVGGIPSLSLTPTDPTQTVQLAAETPGTARSNLQLQTLKFKACASEANIDLLLDRSSSMGGLTPSNVTKMSRLKDAVIELTKSLSDSSIIGIQSFSSSHPTYVPLLQNDIPIAAYGSVKSTIPGKVNGLIAYGNTPTYSALNYSYQILQDAVKKYPEKNFNFILITDGEPTSLDGSSQDPRNHTPNPATQIKDLGVTVYTVGIYDAQQAKDPKLAELLKSVASKPENYFEAPSGDDVKGLLKNITLKICKDPDGDGVIGE